MKLAISLLVSAAIAGGSAPAPKAPPVVTVHAKEFAYSAPRTIKSGVTTFRLVNDGKELHHLTIIRLDKGKTLADLTSAMKTPGPMPAWTTEVGGPNPALPGGSANATLTLEAGDYVMVCFINSPGNPAPHAMKGMMRALVVTGEKSGASEPASDITIRLSDFKFAPSSPLTAGHHVVNVVNDGVQPHEAVLVQLPPGKSIADMGNWVDKSLMKGPPPAKPIGGMAALAKGRSDTFSVDLTAGHYGWICFYPDEKDGKSHFAHGMSQEFTVAAK